MKASEIKIGGKYLVKVSGVVVPVLVTNTFGYTTGTGTRIVYRDGWNCVSLKTNRGVKVKSPQKFRGEVQ